MYMVIDNGNSVACTKINMVMLVSLCAETVQDTFLRLTIFEGYGRNALGYHVYRVSRMMTGDGRTKRLGRRGRSICERELQ